MTESLGMKIASQLMSQNMLDVPCVVAAPVIDWIFRGVWEKLEALPIHSCGNEETVPVEYVRREQVLEVLREPQRLAQFRPLSLFLRSLGKLDCLFCDNIATRCAVWGIAEIRCCDLQTCGEKAWALAAVSFPEELRQRKIQPSPVTERKDAGETKMEFIKLKFSGEREVVINRCEWKDLQVAIKNNQMSYACFTAEEVSAAPTSNEQLRQALKRCREHAWDYDAHANSMTNGAQLSYSITGEVNSVLGETIEFIPSRAAWEKERNKK